MAGKGLSSVVTLLTVAGFSGTALFLSASGRPVTARDAASAASAELIAATNLEGAFIRVADNVGPATVYLLATDDSQRRSAPGPDKAERFLPGTPPNPEADMRRRPSFSGGSGIIVRADGYILTNDHVVEAAKNGIISVFLQDGTKLRGKVFRDPRADLAVVKVDSPKPLPFVKFADSSKVKVGQWAIAIGSPFGQQNTVTTGIVSALHRTREIYSSSMLLRRYANLIQTDAPINPGNSGGPLLNIRGELVGVNVAIFSPSGSSSGIGYAIPANTARWVMEQLVAKGKVSRSALGVLLSDIPPGLRQRLGTDTGAYVSVVMADMPAIKAGIRADDVITRFDDRPISDEGDLRDAIAAAPLDRVVTVSILRGGKPQTVTAKLELLPSDGFAIEEGSPKVPVSPPANQQIGIVSRALLAVERTKYGLSPDASGVLVKSVSPESLADEAGVVSGMLIQSVNGIPVSSVETLNRVMSTARSGDTVTLVVLRPVVGTRPSEAAVNIILP